MATKLIEAPWLVYFFHWRMVQDVGLVQVDYMTSVSDWEAIERSSARVYS